MIEASGKAPPYNSGKVIFSGILMDGDNGFVRISFFLPAIRLRFVKKSIDSIVRRKLVIFIPYIYDIFLVRSMNW